MSTEHIVLEGASKDCGLDGAGAGARCSAVAAAGTTRRVFCRQVSAPCERAALGAAEPFDGIPGAPPQDARRASMPQVPCTTLEDALAGTAGAAMSRQEVRLTATAFD